ncbi:MAG TPA: hypothetical protein VE174_01930 [Actinomycetota bacterium]|nr:hypothetical protein [Actinomycetota bacterium]
MAAFAIAIIVAGVAFVVATAVSGGRFSFVELLLVSVVIGFALLALGVIRQARHAQPATCAECGGVISPNAPTCKHCGEPLH